jgi:osmotically inducible lipoprotein OsmB
MTHIKHIVAAVALLALAACGTTTEDRALSGAALGAGLGAGAGALTGGSLLTGALVGGLLGGAGGALTNSSTVDLGRPIWRN